MLVCYKFNDEFFYVVKIVTLKAWQAGVTKNHGKVSKFNGYHDLLSRVEPRLLHKGPSLYSYFNLAVYGRLFYLENMKNNCVLLISCPDRRGIVARVSSFLFQHKINITNGDVQRDELLNMFFMRIEWEDDGFNINEEDFKKQFSDIARDFKMNWSLTDHHNLKKVAVLVSKEDHCLSDLLYRYKMGELPANLCLVISNHIEAKKTADYYGIPFHFIPTKSDDRLVAEKLIIDLLKKHQINLVVLARYMQILSPSFVQQFQNKIINIHHSFLPAFIGAKPYDQAHRRGVKIIGVTSHYVNEELDGGPIIEQDVIRISHKDTTEDLINKGRDLEKIVLSRAVKWHLENSILVYANKTVIFN